MPRKRLENKPLVEAIFELRWELKEIGQGIKVDPHYKILVGSLYSKLKEEYPHHEPLPASSLPDDMAGYVIQHRFRKGENEWPLIQIGPGILTVNDTAGYIWEDFEKKVLAAVTSLFESYPQPENIKINSLLLRYIDAVEFNYQSDNIFKFLLNHMKTGIKLYPDLFNGTGVESVPASFDWRFSFPCKKPEGIIHLRFIRGKKANADGLIWETMVQSTEGKASQISNQIKKWLNDAHNLTDDWFFKLINGELERRFE
ncbi:MAG: TIGR04255 family protein [Nitrospirae bacterium]|nr:TIGR04255 family protein [Nitrospirota bacterium]